MRSSPVLAHASVHVDLLSIRLSRNWRRLLPWAPVRRLEGELWSQIVVPRLGELWPLNPQAGEVRTVSTPASGSATGTGSWSNSRDDDGSTASLVPWKARWTPTGGGRAGSAGARRWPPCVRPRLSARCPVRVAIHCAGHRVSSPASSVRIVQCRRRASSRIFTGGAVFVSTSSTSTPGRAPAARDRQG
jgi:hypothetical protein